MSFLYESIKDNYEANFEPLVKAAQVAFRNTHPFAFQGLESHSEIPADGAEIFPDRLNLAAGDSVSWTAIRPAEQWSAQRASIRIDQHGKRPGVQMDGFTVTLTFIQASQKKEIVYDYEFVRNADSEIVDAKRVSRKLAVTNL